MSFTALFHRITRDAATQSLLEAVKKEPIDAEAVTGALDAGANLFARVGTHSELCLAKVLNHLFNQDSFETTGLPLFKTIIEKLLQLHPLALSTYSEQARCNVLAEIVLLASEFPRLQRTTLQNVCSFLTVHGANWDQPLGHTHRSLYEEVFMGKQMLVAEKELHSLVSDETYPLDYLINHYTTILKEIYTWREKKHADRQAALIFGRHAASPEDPQPVFSEDPQPLADPSGT